MTPRHRESDTKVHRGRMAKQGNNLVRWAAVEAAQRVRHGPLAATKARLAAGAATTSPRSPPPASYSPSSSTASATDTSAAWPPDRQETPQSRRARREVVVCLTPAGVVE
ncbi:transposase [Micromonospora sp. CB01531]|uniref:transposase n=1 Tax=Micromonospora sp. CB01531 TaxID=1718947 RepID=UPI00093993FE